VQYENCVVYSQQIITDAVIIATALYSNSEHYDVMVSLDDALAPHILTWIYSEGFDKVTNPDEVLEAMLNGVVGLESISKVTVHARTMGEWSLCDWSAITHIFCAIRK